MKAVQTKSGNKGEFVCPVIYFEDDKYVYIDAASDDSVLKTGDFVMPEAGGENDGSDSGTKKMYQIGAVMPLKGVFNINKGYCVFKYIEPLEIANGYQIVKKNREYSLNIYDHIVLDAEGVHNGQIIFG